MTEFSEAQKEYMNQLFERVSDRLDRKVEEIYSSLKTEIVEIRQDIHKFSNISEEKIKHLENQNRQLRESINYLQNKVRKNNLIIFGIKTTTENIWTPILHLFKTTLGIDLSEEDFNDIYKTSNNKDSPIVIEFMSYQKKQLVLKNLQKLKGTHIHIAQDLTPENRAIQKQLVKYMKEARNGGLKSYIKGQKLVIGEEIYTLRQLEEKETVITSDKLDNPREESDSEDTGDCHSIPATPDPQKRQKRILDVLGCTEELEQQAQKKSKSVINKKSTKLTQPNIIKTRSNTTTTT